MTETGALRIGFDGRVLSRSDPTGVERYARNLFEELGKLGAIDLLSPPSTNGLVQHAWTQTGLILECLRRSEDVLLCPSTTAPILLPGHVKLVASIHDINYLLMPEFYSWKFRSYFKTILPQILRRADLVLCNSDYTRATLTERFPRVRAKARTIYHASSDLYRPLGRQREQIILSVASQNPNKNVARLLNAFASVTHRIPHRLVLVGGKRSTISGGSHLDQAMARVPSERIERIGYVADGELLELYNRAEFFVFPSLCEGFGVPPLEAMRSGCPVLASNVTSLPEVCGDAAMYCDPLSTEDIAEKIVLLAGDSALKDRLKEAGIARGSQFTFARCARETLAAINETRREGQIELAGQ